MNKQVLFTFLICFVLTMIVSSVIGQVAPNGSGAFESVNDVTQPIDGGLGFLIAGGIGYGIKKLYARKNK